MVSKQQIKERIEKLEKDLELYTEKYERSDSESRYFKRLMSVTDGRLSELIWVLNG